MNIFRPKSRSKLDGVFYWIITGQIWVINALGPKYEQDGFRNNFMPCSVLSNPNESFDFNEVIDCVEKLTDVVACDNCNRVDQIATSVEFVVRNDIPQPFLNGTGEAYIRTEARDLIQKNGFKGFKCIANSGVRTEDYQKNYWYLATTSSLFQVPGVVRKQEDTCPSCDMSPIVCSVCGHWRKRCPVCKQAREIVELNNLYENGIEADGSGWPLVLSSWNLDDAVGGAFGLIVTGELLEFLIEHEITPFAFGPIEVEADQATSEQMERALRVRRMITMEESKRIRPL